MKKIIVISLGAILIAAGCNNSNPSPTNSDQNQPPPAATTQTYTNATYGFAFDYPTTMTFVTPTYPNLQDKIVQIQMGAEQYPGTNFGDAAFGVSAQFAKSLADCLALTPPENGDGFKTKITLNDTDFYMTNSSGVGAGNLYTSKVYRTVKSTGGACIELNATIHTSNIGNYPAGTVTEVDSAAVQAKLDSVLNSFHFTQ